MNWDDLRFFLALANAKSMSGAGRELGVKHTTVARRIQTLEQRLGSRLFDRLADGYAMTEAGENLQPMALTMQQQSHKIERQIMGLDTQLTGTLNLTAAHDVFNCLVIPYIKLFKCAYPGIELLLSSSAGLLDLSAKQADIALRLTANPPDYLIGKKVFPLTHGLYASAEYLEKHPNPEHLVLWEHSGQQPEWVKQHFKDAQVAVRVNDVTNMVNCVSSGMGVSRLPCFIADSCPDLRRLDLPLKPSDWGIWVLSHVDLRDTARVRACREFLIDIVQQQQALISGLNSRYQTK